MDDDSLGPHWQTWVGSTIKGLVSIVLRSISSVLSTQIIAISKESRGILASTPPQGSVTLTSEAKNLCVLSDSKPPAYLSGTHVG